jgi:lactose/L-arabinose transport system permease protein
VIKKSTNNRIRAIAVVVIAAPLAILWLLPLWMLLISSTLPDSEILSPEVHLFPSTNFFANLSELQSATNFSSAMTISMVSASLYTFLSVLLTSMAGWALVRYEFFGKNAVVAVILGTITLPYAVVVIPQFVMVARDFKLSNSYFALVIPPLFNSIGVLFMRQTFSTLPGELFDAARVEGVREWRVFLYVAMPLARPSLAALSIILFLGSWNNYLWPLLINSTPEMMTAPVALSLLIGTFKTSWGAIMTGATLLTMPMIVVFIFLQRHFIAGISAGAIK